MRTPQLFFLTLVLLSSNASAGFWDYTGPCAILGEEVFDEDWSIADKQGTPIKNVQAYRHIRAWIDIIGFEDESIINDTRYVNGSAKDFAIVKRDAWHTSVDGTVVSFTSTYNIADHNNITTATQTTNFHWKKKKILIGWTHHYESLTVSHAADSPKTFNNSIDDYEITITSYNNSVTPYTLIYMPPRENIIKQSVHYKNNTASWYELTGLVKENNRGTQHVRFLNETGCGIDENETITKLSEYFVINEAPLNWTLLNISVYTPYVEKKDAVCNATIYNSKPSDFVDLKGIVTLFGILAAFGIGIIIVMRTRS